MSDPLRTDPITDHNAPSIDGDAERDAKIESLLLSGLDHYFAADYAQAIDVWTRALFLDRQHARARAYIERARSALAEEQRETEELLHNGVAAFERGEIEAARQLLNAAVQRGGAHEVALAFLTRIDRLSAAASGRAAAGCRAAAAWYCARQGARRWPSFPLGQRGARDRGRGGGRCWLSSLGSGASDAAPYYGHRSRPCAGAGCSGAHHRSAKLGDGHRSSGRVVGVWTLYDALRAVELVRPTDPLRGDADKLKAVIQRELLAHRTSAGIAEPAYQTNR